MTDANIAALARRVSHLESIAQSFADELHAIRSELEANARVDSAQNKAIASQEREQKAQSWLRRKALSTPERRTTAIVGGLIALAEILRTFAG